MLNPFNWNWKPFFAYDGPTPIYPNRKTIAVGWLFFSTYIDIDDGSYDDTIFQDMFMDVVDESDHEVGSKISPFGEGDIFLEQRSKY